MSRAWSSLISRSEPFPSLRKMLSLLPKYTNFWKDLSTFRQQQQRNIPIRYQDLYPQLYDKTTDHGFDRHYIYHTAWAARVLAKSKPKLHVDISSSLYFSAITSAFVPIHFYDFRKIHLELSDLKTGAADLTKLHFKSGSLNSVSCMHTIEHIGLGRYGDPIDAEGDLKAIKELIRVLKPAGQLLIVEPIGKEMKIMFNAHRIYTYEYLLEQFTELKLKEFALILEDSENGLIVNPDKNLLKTQDYACGCFWFVKPSSSKN